MAFFLILFVLLLLLPDAYVWLSFVRGTSALWSVLWWLPSGLALAALGAAAAEIGRAHV